MRVLSVVIPSYNTELYLERCLDSLLYYPELVKKLDIIIVNDGSTDGTAKIAKAYRKKYPAAVQFIDKPNGGHGSTINAGIKVARGKYFKVLDSDDWMNFIDFPKYIEALEKEDADIVITNYKQDFLYVETTKSFDFNTGAKPERHEISEIAGMVDEKNFFFQFSMHSMTVKTKSLQKVWGEGLLERTFYVDQQYVAKALSAAKDFVTYNLDIYRYFIGRPEQSVSAGGFFNHRADHERVLKWLLATAAETKEGYLQAVFKKQVLSMLKTHYDIYYAPLLLPAYQRDEIFMFNDYIAEKYPEIHAQIPQAKNIKLRLSPVRKTKLAKAAAFAKRSLNGKD